MEALEVKAERVGEELSDKQKERVLKISREIREMADLLDRPYGFPKCYHPLGWSLGYNGK